MGQSIYDILKPADYIKSNKKISKDCQNLLTLFP